MIVREALIMRFALDMDNREIARGARPQRRPPPRCCLHRAIRQLEGIVADDSGASSGGERSVSVNVEALLREALTPVEPRRLWRSDWR